MLRKNRIIKKILNAGDRHLLNNLFSVFTIVSQAFLYIDVFKDYIRIEMNNS